MENITELKKLGKNMHRQNELKAELRKLQAEEREIKMALGCHVPQERMTQDVVTIVREHIRDALKACRDRGAFWVAPSQVCALVGPKLGDVTDEEIMRNLRAMSDDPKWQIAHNGSNGRGSMYVFIGIGS